MKINAYENSSYEWFIVYRFKISCFEIVRFNFENIDATPLNPWILKDPLIIQALQSIRVWSYENAYLLYIVGSRKHLCVISIFLTFVNLTKVLRKNALWTPEISWSLLKILWL